MSEVIPKLNAVRIVPNWASLAVVSFEKEFGYSIETISVDLETCSLSGAWDFENLDEPSLEAILSGRLIVPSGIGDEEALAKRFNSRIVKISDFIADASCSAKNGIERFSRFVEENAREYSKYMAIPPSERKNLPKVVKKKLEPIYAQSWDFSFDELKPELTLKQLGKRENIEGTPPNMQRLIATSWLVKHLVDRWRVDEIERKSRSYLYPDETSLDLFPSSWLAEREKLITIPK